MTQQTFPLNTWYVACTPDEIETQPFARKICNIPLVFFRNQDNEIKALEDFCPHRGAALSLGFVENGQLVCGYHGLRMEDSGKVASMPNQRVENFPCIKAYATDERYGFVWLWPGDQALADDKLIPELEWAMLEIEKGSTAHDFSGRQKEVFTIFKRYNTANRHKMIPIPVCEIPKEIM